VLLGLRYALFALRFSHIAPFRCKAQRRRPATVRCNTNCARVKILERPGLRPSGAIQSRKSWGNVYNNVFYDEFYSRALKSKAHSRFFEIVYQIDLCQHGMADKKQVDLLLSYLHLDRSSTVLDLGCGPGLITNYIHNKTGCEIVGIDNSNHAIEYAKNRFESRLNKIRFIEKEMQDLHYEGKLFSAIISIDTHYFIEDFLNWIPKYLALIQDNGQFAIFSDEGMGLKDYDETNTRVTETIIGKYLTGNGLAFEGVELYNENRDHWNIKYKTLLEMKQDFLNEGNEFLYNNRMGEAENESTKKGGRYLYIVTK
jgi:cyclopropane fatty-acyl-phospholipid synthase-like methyltransferase